MNIRCRAPHVQMWCSPVWGTSCSPPSSPSHHQSPDLIHDMRQRSSLTADTFKIKPKALRPRLASVFVKTEEKKTLNKDRLTKNAHVVSAVLLGLLDDGSQRVSEVLEQGVLLVDLHAQNTVQELPNVVVVCGSNTERVLDPCEHTLDSKKQLQCHNSKKNHLCPVRVCQICPPHLWAPRLSILFEFLEKRYTFITRRQRWLLINNNNKIQRSIQ